MMSLELARSMHEERVHAIEAEYEWRSIRAQLEDGRRRGPRLGLRQRLASLWVGFSLQRSR